MVVADITVQPGLQIGRKNRLPRIHLVKNLPIFHRNRPQHGSDGITPEFQGTACAKIAGAKAPGQQVRFISDNAPIQQDGCIQHRRQEMLHGPLFWLRLALLFPEILLTGLADDFPFIHQVGQAFPLQHRKPLAVARLQQRTDEHGRPALRHGSRILHQGVAAFILPGLVAKLVNAHHDGFWRRR